jgi:hypothetical protein
MPNLSLLKRLVFVTLILTAFACNQDHEKSANDTTLSIKLDITEASRLAALPLACIQNPLPYKSGLVIVDSSDLQHPGEHHPAFYGCFDWHSAVHGHWSLVYLLKTFPEIENADEIRKGIDKNLSAENILKELDYFKLNRYTSSFERTYGWAWLLKLQEELYSWDDPQARMWYKNLKPLAEFISQSYIEYLPKLVYPIRVGEHTNTAFGLDFAYDYALMTNDAQLKEIIIENARRFYLTDRNCPIGWEPSGYDFLSPCLQELNIMRKILDTSEFRGWSASFLPDLMEGTLQLEPGKIKDRTDGKLVHLDGLNFSRAWCLYALHNNDQAYQIAQEHMAYSLNNIVDGDYAGQHWLASFALYAYKIKKESAHAAG